MSFDKFDTYVLNKGYEFQNVDEKDACESRSYVYKRDKQNMKYATSFINIYKYYDGEQMVSWEIIDKVQYLKIKKEIKANGFLFKKTYTHNGAVLTEYTKGKLKATLLSDTGETSSGETLTNYEIGVTISTE